MTVTVEVLDDPPSPRATVSTALTVDKLKLKEAQKAALKDLQAGQKIVPLFPDLTPDMKGKR